MKSKDANHELKALREYSKSHRETFLFKDKPVVYPESTLSTIMEHITKLKKTHPHDANLMASISTIEFHLASIGEAFKDDHNGKPKAEQMHWVAAAYVMDSALHIGLVYAAMIDKLTLAPGKEKNPDWNYVQAVHDEHPTWRKKEILDEAEKRCLKDGKRWTLKRTTAIGQFKKMTQKFTFRRSVN